MSSRILSRARFNRLMPSPVRTAYSTSAAFVMFCKIRERHAIRVVYIYNSMFGWGISSSGKKRLSRKCFVCEAASDTLSIEKLLLFTHRQGFRSRIFQDKKKNASTYVRHSYNSENIWYVLWCGLGSCRRTMRRVQMPSGALDSSPVKEAQTLRLKEMICR